MKITIDTKEDSHEDLKKVIRMLQHLVGDDAYTNSPNIFEETSSTPTEATNAFVNMFGESQSSSAAEEKPKIKKSYDDVPQIIPY